ncbi:hypothetical protein GCM10009865_08310 [Aeromicrobium ponti]|uniref:Uncharacterized protein DUF3231 n=1 Tax=Cytobacillus oceanisediminis TaxID=665099 RepID=A0A562K745_9BACI|nr:DUF3231 family protein [Cytobacillus oceanisediminis]TWH91271.1 uncharacterized protein DUF3231 [Cytobacillus oceanisediminis]
MHQNKTRLTAAEIASLWTSYMNDSMAKCVLGFMLKHLEDKEIKGVVQYAYDLASGHLKKLVKFYKQDELALPDGFSDNDVNMGAPWLFSDIFCLTYVNHMARTGLISYGGFLSMSSREDICDYYTKGLYDTSVLYNKSNRIALKKGLLARHPSIETPNVTEYIDSKNYLSGLNPLVNKRPLNAIEISHLYMNVMTNAMGVNLSLSFAQTSPSKEVSDFMLRGAEIANKHIKIFTDILLQNDIPTPRLPDVSVSNSVTKTFSDKLVMFHISLISAAGTGNYATAAAASQRSDLAMNYERLSIEIAKYAKTGADIMIKHHWMEKPPGTKDRKKLASSKKGS